MQMKQTEDFKCSIQHPTNTFHKNIPNDTIYAEQNEQSQDNNFNQKSELDNSYKIIKQTQKQNNIKSFNKCIIIFCIFFIVAIYCVIFWVFVSNINLINYQHQGKQWKKNNQIIMSKQSQLNTISTHNTLINSQSNAENLQNRAILSLSPSETPQGQMSLLNTIASQTSVIENGSIVSSFTVNISQFNIKVQKLPPYTMNQQSIANYGIDKDLQVASPFDYLNITQTPQFRYFKQNWKKTIKAQIYQFQYNSSLQKKPEKLNYTQFKNQQQINQYLQTLNTYGKKLTHLSDLALFLSSKIVWNMKDVKLKQIELFYMEKKYNISKYQDQLPICVFTTGYKIFSRDRHIYFFQSIQQQNYSNYHVVAVDDATPNNQGYQIYKYLNNSNLSLKNKAKVVVNLQKMGATALTYHWTTELCRKGDIIVHVDMDDMLIGRQVFKALNALYHNPDIWYIYTRYLRQDDAKMIPDGGMSKNLTTDVKNYRRVIQWKTSAMRTLRYEVFKNVPVEYLIEYQYNSNLHQFIPKFYDTDADRFLIYAHLQLSGNKRIKYINDVFYYYNITHSISRKCNAEHQHYDQYKSRIKIPLQPMKNLQDINITSINNMVLPPKIYQNFKQRVQQYLICKKRNKLS